MNDRVSGFYEHILICICLLLLGNKIVIAQNQRIADSLALIYIEDTVTGEARLELLRNLAYNENRDYDKALEYADALIDLSFAEKNLLYQFRGFRQKGRTNLLIGNFEEALKAYFLSLEAARKANFPDGEGSAYIGVADTYSEMGNSQNALSYYNEAIQILHKINDSISLATALINTGDEYYKIKKYDSALLYFTESGKIFKNVDFLIGDAYSRGNIGMVYASSGNHELAKTNIDQAITILEELEDYYAISEYLTHMSDIYRNQGDLTTSFDYAEASLKMAQKYGIKQQISESNLQLSKLYESLGNSSASLRFYKNHIAYLDSIRNLETVQKMADIRTDFEVSQKQIEIDLANQQKRYQLVILGFVLTVLLTLLWFYFSIRKEKKKSEVLLLNILPSAIAKELKLKGSVDAQDFDQVSVLFTDFKGFTTKAEKLSARDLVKEINHCFKAFDHICEKYKIEKIKTIGDAYMAAGGLPVPSDDAVMNTVLAALEMQKFMADRIAKKKTNNEVPFEMRLGIHTGPVVAGIVGVKKFQYDIWGDTVNTGSRMESNGMVGKVNISEHTYDLIKNDKMFSFEKRGKIDVKGKGELEMYFVSLKNVA